MDSPAFLPRALRVRLALTPEQVLVARGEQRRALRKRYVIEAVWQHFRARLIQAFGGRCFHCGAAPPLDLDHCVPLLLGGRLVPGNITPLCRRCNNLKGAREPEEFYRPEELARLMSLLSEQPSLMAFHWHWSRWSSDREARRAYLLEIGLDAATVQAMFEDPAHPWYVEPIDDTPYEAPPPVMMAPMPALPATADSSVERWVVWDYAQLDKPCTLRVPAWSMRRPEPKYFMLECETCGYAHSFQYERLAAVRDARTGAPIEGIPERMRSLYEGGPVPAWEAWWARYSLALEFAAHLSKVAKVRRAMIEDTLAARATVHYGDERFPAERISRETRALVRAVRVIVLLQVSTLIRDESARQLALDLCAGLLPHGRALPGPEAAALQSVRVGAIDSMRERAPT